MSKWKHLSAFPCMNNQPSTVLLLLLRNTQKEDEPQQQRDRLTDRQAGTEDEEK